MRHPRLLAALISVILLCAGPELILQLFDPWRVKAYFGDLSQVATSVIPDRERGYVLPEGDYQFSNWTATILPDHTRLVPDTGQSGCRIAFVGDSVTFGLGVNDGDTWVNLLAQEEADVHFLNAGLNGYNAAQAGAAVDSLPADGYLYLLINNDADRRVNWPQRPRPRAFYEPIWPLYWYVLQTRQGDETTPDYRVFDAAIDALKQGNVIIVGLAGDSLARRANVPTIPYWTHVNSAADRHANAAGNVEIAGSLRPFLDTLLEAVCPS